MWALKRFTQNLCGSQKVSPYNKNTTVSMQYPKLTILNSCQTVGSQQAVSI